MNLLKTSNPLSLLFYLALLVFASSGFAVEDAVVTKEKIKQLQADISNLETQLGSQRQQSGSLEAGLKNAEKKAGKLSQLIASTKKQVEEQRIKLEDLKRQQQHLQQQRKVQSEVLGQQLAAAYRIGQQDQIKLLLNQQQPERLSRILRYYKYVSRSKADALAQFEETLDALQKLGIEVSERQQGLLQQQQQQQLDALQLQQHRKERESALLQLKKKIGADDVQLQRLKQDHAQLALVLKRLQQSLQQVDLAWESKDFAQLKGKLRWPTTGRITERYGSRSVQGVKTEGIMINAPMGRPVNVVHHGRVVFSDWFRSFGLLMIVDHGSGYMTLYGHNQSLLKDVGDWVSADEKIATVGDSGGLSSTGLYFAIRHKGQPHNPKPWLSAKQG